MSSYQSNATSTNSGSSPGLKTPTIVVSKPAVPIFEDPRLMDRHVDQ